MGLIYLVIDFNIMKKLGPKQRKFFYPCHVVNSVSSIYPITDFDITKKLVKVTLLVNPVSSSIERIY
jgi:hypothetical protein